MMGADTSFQIDDNGYIWIEDAGGAEEQWQDDQQQDDWQMHEQWQDLYADAVPEELQSGYWQP